VSHSKTMFASWCLLFLYRWVCPKIEIAVWCIAVLLLFKCVCVCRTRSVFHK
jgi:hypothetical protein